MSTNRAARALARAERVANQPPRENQPQINDEINAPAEPIVGMTNTDKYSSVVHFNDMLQRIGLSRACINQLAVDDFDTMEVIVQQYKHDIGSFEAYLKSINKSMNNPPNPVRFPPIMMDRLLSVSHHFVQAVSCFHTMPDIDLIDRETSLSLIDPYRVYKRFETTDVDEEVLITLLELKGHENWITYRDKFLSNLGNIVGSNGTPISYVVDKTPRIAKRGNQPFTETRNINLYSWETYTQKMIHFGPHFKKDNHKVWQILKKSLLGSQPYHHIDHCARQENGQRAWNALRAYYEGEDYVNKTIQECLTRVRTMYYRGETPRFTFEKFIDCQKECY